VKHPADDDCDAQESEHQRNRPEHGAQAPADRATPATPVWSARCSAAMEVRALGAAS
jgi:hypothetical protein